VENFYETLQVSEKASDEVIKKAYNVLAKKYHPDLQPPEKRKFAEETMKKINESYEVLKDEKKRREYDELLQGQRESQRIKNQSDSNYANMNNSGYNNQNTNTQERNQYARREYEQEQLKRNMTKRYASEYKKEIRKIRTEMTLRKIRDFFIAISIMALVGIILWFTPPSRKILIQFYEENFIVKAIVDLIANGIKSMKHV